MSRAVMVSGEDLRDSALCIHVSALPQAHLPSRLPQSAEQVPCAMQQAQTGYPLQILQCIPVHAKLCISAPAAFLPLATINSVSKSVSFCFVNKFICLISFWIPYIESVI